MSVNPHRKQGFLILAMSSIAEERKDPAFDIREMTYFLDGSKKKTLVNNYIISS